MGLTFADGTRAALLARVLVAGNVGYAPIVTPNVDVVTRHWQGRLPPQTLDQAAMLICDSRVLTLLARLCGKRLTCYPGADLVADLLHDPALRTTRIAVVGPSLSDFDRLRARFPHHRLAHIPAPRRLVPGSAAARACAQACADAPWDVLLICLGSPKQEWLAQAIGAIGRARGTALMVGASVDFLTGRQHRAPRLIRRLSLEWLYRLLRDPRRLWRRYLVDNPAILGLFVRLEVLPRLRRAPAVSTLGDKRG